MKLQVKLGQVNLYLIRTQPILKWFFFFFTYQIHMGKHNTFTLHNFTCAFNIYGDDILSRNKIMVHDIQYFFFLMMMISLVNHGRIDSRHLGKGRWLSCNRWQTTVKMERSTVGRDLGGRWWVAIQVTSLFEIIVRSKSKVIYVGF